MLFLFQIDKVELPFDKVKDQRRAFCFVEFKTEESVKKVLEETAHKLNNVDVSVWKKNLQSFNDNKIIIRKK